MKVLVFAVLFVALAHCLPTNYDFRSNSMNCGQWILNQEECGSCWDFCSMESFADRMCVEGSISSTTIVSPEPILECSRQGCNGGNPSTAWNWVISNGDTTCTSQCFGGCAPYDSGSGTSPACHDGTCDSGSKWPITYHASSYQALTRKDNTQFQTELYNNGPLQACFNVYNNFYTYFSLHPKGIYTSSSGSLVGGHCVKMIGWGVDNGQDYWLFANSWDTTWADGGFFKMARGTDLCGIENQVSEGFTKSQAARLQLNFTGIHPNVDREYIVGGWHQQTADAEIVVEATEAAARLLSEKYGRTIVVSKVISAETQVVAGVNFRMKLEIEGKAASLRIFRNLSYDFFLRAHEFA